MKKKLPEQWLITDSKTIDPIIAAEKLPKNSGIILRDYELSEKEKLEIGKVLKKICIRKKLVFLVAKEPKLALMLKADGIHLPEFMRGEIHKWRSKKPDWIITAAVHSPRAALYAQENSADAIFVSPILPTKSHLLKKPLGMIGGTHYIYRGINAYGLGGLNMAHHKALKMAGFRGFAGISWVENCASKATVAPVKGKKY